MVYFTSTMLHMRFYPFVMYSDNPDQGGGGQPNQGGNATNGNEKNQILFTEEEAKELGITDKDSIRNMIIEAKQNNISAEEKEKRTNQEKANFIKFAADNNLMKVEEVNRFEEYSKKQDKDLVFEKFSKEYTDDDPDAKPENIQAAFDLKYDLSSESNAQKKWAERQIAKEAKEIRSPLESAYSTAQSKYSEDKNLRSKIPGFNKFFETVIKENTPETVTLFKTKDGDSDIVVDVKLTDADRKEIMDRFHNDKGFVKYISAKDEASLKASLVKKINGVIRDKYFETAMSTAVQKGKDLGTTKGSNVGSGQPFSVVKKNENPEGSQTKVLSIEESNAKMAEARQRFSRR